MGWRFLLLVQGSSIFTSARLLYDNYLHYCWKGLTEKLTMLTKKAWQVIPPGLLVRLIGYLKISGTKICTSPPVLNVDVKGTCWVSPWSSNNPLAVTV